MIPTSDPTSILMPPRKEILLTPAMKRMIMACLATRFGIRDRTITQKIIPDRAMQWAKVRRIEGGDVMHGRSLVKLDPKGRDASFVQVRKILCYDIICIEVEALANVSIMIVHPESRQIRTLSAADTGLRDTRVLWTIEVHLCSPPCSNTRSRFQRLRYGHTR
jgi:hypothetical protein